jgi:hypothetical protein
MKLNLIARLAGALVLAGGLAGCMDITMELEVLSDTTGKMTTTSAIGADMYPMLKGGMESMMGAAGAAGTTTGDATAEASGGFDFCDEEKGGVLTENADGSATCVETVEGELATLIADNESAKVELLSPGLVKFTFSTTDMQEELNSSTEDPNAPAPADAAEQAAMEAQAKAMMAAFFAGKNITLRVKGKEIVETNMTKSADGTSAEVVIPFVDLLNGTATLPPEYTVTVKTN